MSAEPAAGRIVVLDIVGLQPSHLDSETTPTLSAFLDDRATGELQPSFPALTVPAQTTLTTGQSPGEHGDVASGEYDRESDTVAFWERDRDGRQRLWEFLTEQTNLTTGALFFQHLIGTSADVAVTPSPIEDEDNNMIEMDCWSNPDGFYDDLREEFGHFPLHSYWGPGASEESTEWILDAARESVERNDPDLLWVYVPHLDYAGLKSGPDGDEMDAALATVDELVGEFLSALKDDRWNETAVAVLSEYGFHEADTPVFPNRRLQDEGLLTTVDSGDVDHETSRAFAMVDHQIAHVYADDEERATAREALEELYGVDLVLGDDGKRERGIDHPNAGDFVLVADPDAWFQYYWWDDDEDAPPYATEMDIHAKPGFDPCELFIGDAGLVSLDASKVGGSHGRVDAATTPVFGLGGPAATDVTVPERVDARAVAPTICEMLEVEADIDRDFEQNSIQFTD